MSRHLGLRHLERIYDVTDAQLAVMQETQYSQTRSVTERPEHEDLLYLGAALYLDVLTSISPCPWV